MGCHRVAKGYRSLRRGVGAQQILPRTPLKKIKSVDSIAIGVKDDVVFDWFSTWIIRTPKIITIFPSPRVASQLFIGAE